MEWEEEDSTRFIEFIIWRCLIDIQRINARFEVTIKTSAIVSEVEIQNVSKKMKDFTLFESSPINHNELLASGIRVSIK